MFIQEVRDNMKHTEQDMRALIFSATQQVQQWALSIFLIFGLELSATLRYPIISLASAMVPVVNLFIFLYIQ